MSEELKEKAIKLFEQLVEGTGAKMTEIGWERFGENSQDVADQLLELFESYAKEREVRARKYELNWAIEYHRGKPNPPLAREYFRKRLAQLEPSADDKPKAKPFTAEELKPKGWTDDRFA